MTVSTIEKREFQAHRKLLQDVILRQAGTLYKAIAEAIMNSIDAKATTCKIILSNRSVKIIDDGIGIQSRQELVDHFETFGTPHSEEEQKQMGEFRMGRGQLFAYGVNTWTTGPFVLNVDVKTEFAYTLQDNPTPNTSGTEIEILLYDTLTDWQLSSLRQSLESRCKYMPIEVLLDGALASKPLDAYTWTHEDEYAYYRLHEKSGCLQVFSKGVFVRDISSYTHGFSGEVVTKQKLRLNFARNEIQDDCPIWQSISQVFRTALDSSLIKKSRFNGSERKVLCEDLRHDRRSFDALTDKKILTLANGQTISFTQLIKASHKGIPISFAEDGDRQADYAIRQNRAIVLSTETVLALGFGRYQRSNLASWIQSKSGESKPLGIVDFRELDMSTDYRILPPADWSKDELLWQAVASDAQETLRV